MKKSIFYSFLLLSFLSMWGCKKTGNYPGGVISPYISIYDIRDSYKGSDVTLTSENLFGSSKITGIVVSDHSGNNLPSGLLVIQDRRRLSELRGISINIGADAASYVPGDSLIVNVEGGLLKRVEGILQITGLTKAAVTKISSGNSIAVNQVPSNAIVANPDKYESTLLVIVKGGFNPLPGPTDVLKGDKLLNDGFADITLHTEAAATFANNPAPFLANFTGIVFNTQVADKIVPQLRMRKASDIVVLSSTVNVQPIIISGFISDVAGGDGNFEYVQCIATRDINFATTPYSMVFTNNANASVPTGYPASGWATGNMRTYKLNLTSGTVTKGSYFYVGGTSKLINGTGSTSIAGSNWIKAFNYTTTDGDGFGLKTSGLLANSGNASGIAVFAGTNVTLTSIPVDVLFVSTGGSLYTTTPSVQGYRIGNNDWYDITNPITLDDQPFYRSGSNTLNMTYTTADLGYFYIMGGEYNVTLGRWSKARSQTNVLLTKTSTLAEIENASSTKLK
ncbi:MAG: hypothetical protein JWQ30_72 [Sediminibacterium sp.]|nr:hypothetical protein [Sediminibacterium sp.]